MGFNNLAVSLSLGAMGQRKQMLKILTAFGITEFTVPLIGAYLGKNISTLIVEYSQWLGPSLLILLGIYTFFSVRDNYRDQLKLADKLTSWKGLLFLAIGLSFDNLIVGFSFGIVGITPLTLALTIALFSVSFAAIGLVVGEKLKKEFSELSVRVTGILLIILGLLTWVGWI